MKKLDNSLKVFLSVMFFFFSLYGISQAEYVIDEGSAMLYIEPLQDLPNSTIPTGWTTLDYDTSQDEGKGDNGTDWQTGTYGVGYGDGDDNTDIDNDGSVYSVYTRAEFNVADVAEVISMNLGVDYDDGFVAWINGVEVARSTSMPADTPVWNTSCTSHEASKTDPPTYEVFDISAFVGNLVNGRNVLAIGAWNHQPTLSTDLSLIPQLNLFYSASTSPVLTRYPYIQKTYSDSVTIVWDTAIATSNNMVEYGLTQSYGSVAYDLALESQHIVTLTGLDPATQYYYRVLSGGTVLTASGTTFQTNQDETSPAYTFVVFGDSGEGSPGQSKVAQLIGDIFPDLLLHTGDVVYERSRSDTPEIYATYYNPRYFIPYKDTIKRVPFYPTLGNHDVKMDSGAAYLDAFVLPDVESGSGTENYYSFDYANAHFVFLEVEESYLYSPGTPQHTWLEADLSATPDNKWKFVFFHKPAYSGNTEGDDHSSNPKIQEYLSPLFDAYGVHIVFSGHSHSYERTKPIRYNTILGQGYVSPSGVTYVVTGGGGGTLKDTVMANWWTAAYLDHIYHVTKISINGDYLGLKAVTPNGEVFDSYTIIRNTFTHELIPPSDTTVAPGEHLGFIEEMGSNISADYQFYIQPYVIRPNGATVWLWSTPRLIIVPSGGIIRPRYSLRIPIFSEDGTFYYGIRLTDLDGELIDDKSFAFEVSSGGAVAPSGMLSDNSSSKGWRIESVGKTDIIKGKK